MENESRRSALMLIPLFLFVVLFVGTGTYLTMQGKSYAFYELPAPVAVLPSFILALFLARGTLKKNIESIIEGAGHPDVLAMCFIYLLAGAFSFLMKKSGGAEATVAFGLNLVPSSIILPGLFIVAGFVSTSMGTSMGTIAAISPIALGIANETGLNPALVAGVVLGGAMFGDNLSFISDTTIAATRSQGCEMKDKFRENFFWAAIAAGFSLLIFGVLGSETSAVSPKETNAFLVLPYVGIIALALMGVNVFLVLLLGIAFAGAACFFTVESYSLLVLAKDIYEGFKGMQEIFLLSLFLGGLGHLIKEQGGIHFVLTSLQKVTDKIKGKSQVVGEFLIFIIVGFADLATANNTVAIILSGDMAKNIAKKEGIEPKRSASILDISSCIVQGLIPFGAQVLLLGSTFKISGFDILVNNYYCLILAVVIVLSMVLKGRAKSMAIN